MPASGFGDVVQVDTLELGGGNSFHCVLMCVDTFTKWVEVVPLQHHDAASVAHAFVSVCARWGPPRLLRSDKGTEFVNAITDVLFSRFGVSVQRGAIRHPQSQGSAERFNRTLLTLIRKVLTDADDWRAELDLLLYHYRIRPHAVTKISPMHAMCGWTPRDLIGESVTDPVSLRAWVHGIAQHSTHIRDHLDAALSAVDFQEPNWQCPHAVGENVLFHRPARHQKCLSPFDSGWHVKHQVSPSTVAIDRVVPALLARVCPFWHVGADRARSAPVS